ncbi:hypothetical protein HGG82_00900 [Marinomonas sp. M1K-6]|uniref:Uncharacterized protein n=1 Tax=Marinomonas profundi TaxID=2726122 RepID=A0A847QW32_9GAMM|nr:hypothetical protein [Marinomonas profundi]NLQ16179.1 hypothetical protein [Marinomonas profundi]
MISKLQYTAIYLPVFLVLWLGLFLDSADLAAQLQYHSFQYHAFLQYNQWITNGLVFLCFAWVYSRVATKLKKLMLYGVVLALLGEVVFAIWLGMYEYRLENVPLYVPLGHSLVYAAVFYLQKEKIIQRNKTRVVSVLYWAMIVYSSLWLVFDKDVFGFLCMLGVVYFLRKKPSNELFFLIMFFMVVYLELLGTYYQCWVWPETWFNKVPFITSSNPPSGISVFYFAFDIGCLWLYKKFNSQQWRRMKSLRRLSMTKGIEPSA